MNVGNFWKQNRMDNQSLLTALAIGTFIVGVVLMFSYEIKTFYQKLTANKWGRLFFPLFFITALLVLNQAFIVSRFLYVVIGFTFGLVSLGTIMPLFLAKTCVLLALPALVATILFYYNKNHLYAQFEYTSYLCFLCWLFGVLLIVS